MKLVSLLLILLTTSVAFAERGNNIHRGERKLEECYSSSHDSALCVNKFFNRKLNRILNKLKRDQQDVIEDELKVCYLKVCTYKGDLNDPEEIARCDSGSHGIYKSVKVNARSENHARRIYFNQMHDTEGDGVDSIKRVTCY